MSTQLHGWIEVNTIRFSEESIWLGIFDVGVILSQNYDIYGPLFGVRCERGIEPIAPNRGIPKDASYRTKEEAVWRVNQTWISFSEYSNNINKIPLDEYDWGWLLINELMKDLSTHYGEENIRVVVCFD